MLYTGDEGVKKNLVIPAQLWSDNFILFCAHVIPAVKMAKMISITTAK